MTAMKFNASNRHTALAMITTAAGEKWPDDHLFSSPRDYGLAKDCYLRWKLFTLPNELIERKLGALEGTELRLLQKKAQAIFAWA
jgi:mRNA interferase MazF